MIKKSRNDLHVQERMYPTKILPAHLQGKKRFLPQREKCAPAKNI